MDVHEPRGDDAPGGVQDLRGRGTLKRADGLDAPAAHADIRPRARRAGAVHHRPTADQQIKHRQLSSFLPGSVFTMHPERTPRRDAYAASVLTLRAILHHTQYWRILVPLCGVTW